MDEDKPIDTNKGMVSLARMVDEQINVLIEIEPILRKSQDKKISAIHPLFSTLIEDCISLRLLGNDSRLNQCYIISRALLERLINYCYLLIADEEEFNSFIDYSNNKAARSLSQSLEVNGEVKASLKYESVDYSLPENLEEAISKFTSAKGREITRWTKANLAKRADLIDKKANKTALFVHILAIYSDASEAIHGTLYGSIFHLGAFSPNNSPKDQESLDKHRFSTLSTLYLLTGSALNTLISFLYQIGINELKDAKDKSDNLFEASAKATGLQKIESNKASQPTPKNGAAEL